MRERRIVFKAKRLINASIPLIAVMPVGALRNNISQCILALTQIVLWIVRVVDVPTPIFVNRHRTAATFSDSQLYDLRITSCSHIPTLISNEDWAARWGRSVCAGGEDWAARCGRSVCAGGEDWVARCCEPSAPQCFA